MSRWSQWSRWLPLTGIAFAVLLIVSFAISGTTPDVNDSGQHVINYFTDNRGTQLASGFLGAYAAVFFLFFAATLRAYLRRVEPETEALAAMSLAGAVLLAAGGAIFSSLTIALSDAPDKLGPDAAQALNVLNNDMFAPLVVGACVFMAANAIAILRFGVLPAWLGWIGIVIAIVAVTPIGFFGVLATVVWVIVVSVVLFLRTPTAATAAPAAPPAPPRQPVA